MRSMIGQIFLIVIFLLATPQLSRSAGTGMVCINENCFTVEIAVTPAEHSRGLMYRTALGAGSGMLFTFPYEGRHGFWMKNTIIPLDIIWIGADRKVIDIKKNAPPCKTSECPSYGPGGDAAYVLEINGGLSENMGFKKGDEVTIKR